MYIQFLLLLCEVVSCKLLEDLWSYQLYSLLWHYTSNDVW